MDLHHDASSVETTEKPRSSQRIRYEAEVSALKKRVGDLEAIRASLGLTQRKMAQLLLVDPSAWTRWTRDGEDAPPVIYRALGWYLALEGKYPALSPEFWLQGVAKLPAERESLEEERLREVREAIGRLEARLVATLEAQTPSKAPQFPRLGHSPEVQSRFPSGALVSKPSRVFLVGLIVGAALTAVVAGFVR